MILTLYKPPGWTPLEAMEAHRARTPELTGEPMVYAGRLDPMAEGVLVVLTGEDRSDLAKHLAYDKDYVATFAFGVRSDTHDALGRLTPGSTPPSTCAAGVAGLVGTHALPLPAWSAFRVRGRPLHAWAREGRLGEVAVPVRDMRVLAVGDITSDTVRASALLDDVRSRITRVCGDFRQHQALADWDRLGDTCLKCITAKLTVTSGTYVRALAHALGERLGCGGLLFALRRTRVGPYTEPGV